MEVHRLKAYLSSFYSQQTTPQSYVVQASMGILCSKSLREIDWHRSWSGYCRRYERRLLKLPQWRSKYLEGMKVKVKVTVVSDSLRPHGLYSPGNSPGQNTGVGGHALLQGIFATRGSNPGLLNWSHILYHLSHKGSLGVVKESAYCIVIWIDSRAFSSKVFHLKWADL